MDKYISAYMGLLQGFGIMQELVGAGYMCEVVTVSDGAFSPPGRQSGRENGYYFESLITKITVDYFNVSMRQKPNFFLILDFFFKSWKFY